MALWLVVCLKELKDVGRDRKTLMGLLIFPVLGPLVVYFMMNMIIDIGEEVLDISLPVLGVENAPDLIDFLQQSGIEIEKIESDYEVVGFSADVTESVKTWIESRQYDFVLIIPDDFEDKIAVSETVNLELHHDSSRTRAQAKRRRAEQLIAAWNNESLALRLLLRGVDSELLAPINIVAIDVASAQARANAILGMVPLFVIMAAFVGGMGVAIDATAGERERKSLEPLLVNPVSRSTFIIGKWVAAMVFSIMALVLVMALNLLVLSKIPLERIGITYNIGLTEVVGILLTTLPLAMFATSLQIFIGIFARSFKDAQTYLSLLMMLPMAPYLFNILNTSGREFWMNFVPMLGQNMLLADVVSGRTPGLLDFALAGASLSICCLVFILFSARLFKRESIIFS